MDTEVAFDPRLEKTVSVVRGIDAALALDPKRLFGDGRFLVIDGIGWRADFDPMRRALSSRERGFGAPTKDKVATTPEAQEQVKTIIEEADEMFNLLYPGWRISEHSSSWRNMRSGPEPMYFDSYDVGENTLVLAIVNVHAEAREYRIGWRLSDLCRDRPELMRELWTRWRPLRQNFSVEMRDRWLGRKDPFEGEIPGHRVLLAPESIWFFNPKLILHELVRGNGIVTISWHVENSGSRSQEDLLNRLI